MLSPLTKCFAHWMYNIPKDKAKQIYEMDYYSCLSPAIWLDFTICLVMCPLGRLVDTSGSLTSTECLKIIN